MMKSIFLFVSVQIFVLSSNGQTTNFIDRESKVSGFFEKGWYIKNIPFVEIPDQNIEDVYYYRWSSHKRHLRYTALGLGYTVTEFVSDVSWQNKLAVINDAGGHHIYESRWIRDPDQRYVKVNFFRLIINNFVFNLLYISRITSTSMPEDSVKAVLISTPNGSQMLPTMHIWSTAMKISLRRNWTDLLTFTTNGSIGLSLG